MQFNSNYNNSPVTCYDTYRLFINGESHYRALFQDIKQAKECIYVLFYTIHHDVMGEALVKALTQKAEEGVTVMVMCDFIANLPTPRKMYEPLVKAGGKVIRVKPYLTHYRSHRKIVTIDHKIGYIGGMNIGKQYANLAEKKNPWRDTQIRLTGACAVVLDAYFLKDFLCAVRQKDWEDMVKYMESIHPVSYTHLDVYKRQDLDNAKKLQLRKKIAEENEITVRSLYRYEKAYQTVKLFPCQAWDPREIRTHPEWKK